LVALATSFVGLLSRAFKFGTVQQSPGKWSMSGLLEKVGQKETPMPRSVDMNRGLFYKLFWDITLGATLSFRELREGAGGGRFFAAAGLDRLIGLNLTRT
jgi:hypothetical protein